MKSDPKTKTFAHQAALSCLQAYAVHKLVKAMRDDDGSQEGLLVVAVWCIGEFGDMLLSQCDAPSGVTYQALEPMSVIDEVEKVTKRVTCPSTVKQRSLTCFAKLTDRFSSAPPTVLDRLREKVRKYESSMNLEMQIRACEYSELMRDGRGALARMPVVDPKVSARRQARGGSVIDVGAVSSAAMPQKSGPGAVADVQGGGDLLDLLDLGGGGAPAPAQQVAPAAQQQMPQNPTQSSDADLLSDIFAAPMPGAAPIQPVAPLVGGGGGGGGEGETCSETCSAAALPSQCRSCPPPPLQRSLPPCRSSSSSSSRRWMCSRLSPSPQPPLRLAPISRPSPRRASPSTSRCRSPTSRPRTAWSWRHSRTRALPT